MRIFALFLSTALALVACSDAFSPPPGLRFARISYLCTFAGPGGRTVLWLRGVDAFPVVDVALFERRQANGVWVAPSDTVVATYYSAIDQYENGSGTITMTRSDRFPILGRVDLQFGTKRISGEFQAQWVEPPVC